MSSGILEQLNFCRDKRFTGKLCVINLNGDSVDTLQGHCWNLFFYRGRMIGDSAGVHPVRRLRRQFSEQRIDLPEEIESSVLGSINIKNLSFCAIGDLLNNHYLDREQAEKIVMGSLVEVLFDILHYETISNLTNKPPLSYILESEPLQDNNVPAIMIKIENVWETSTSQFKVWQDNGLIKYSPNLSPQVADLAALKEQVPTKTYEKILLLIEEDRTLRDIAVKIDEQIEVLAKSLLGMCRKNIMALRRTNDIDFSDGKGLTTDIKEVGTFGFFTEQSVNTDQKLVIHLTNNDKETTAIKTTIEKSGHQYLNLQNPSQALITLLKHDPDLILIDAASAGVNAQDMCDLLRGTSKFKRTPIVVLSQQETLVDRLRNNAAEYVVRPLSHQKIFSLMNKYLAPQAA
jgi:two-component system, chemotaxis family, response regulator PixG